MSRYSVLLLPDANVGGYTVEVPAIPGIITEGDTRDEALANARDAIRLYLEDAAADGEDLPVEADVPELAAVEVSLPSHESARQATTVSAVGGNRRSA